MYIISTSTYCIGKNLAHNFDLTIWGSYWVSFLFSNNLSYLTHTHTHSPSALKLPTVKIFLLGNTKFPLLWRAPQKVHGLLSLSTSTTMGPTDSRPASLVALRRQFDGENPLFLKKYANVRTRKRRNWNESVRHSWFWEMDLRRGMMQ